LTWEYKELKLLFLGGYPLTAFVFMKEELKENIENILKNLKILLMVVASVGNVENSLLEFEKGS
jgi:hypothetical protein